MSLNDNLYFLLTPLLIGTTYLSAFENGKTTCKRFTTNYFLYLLTSLSIYFSALKAYDKNIVKVQLMGNCVSCSVNQMTLKNGVEMTIKKHAPEIQEVVSIE